MLVYNGLLMFTPNGEAVSVGIVADLNAAPPANGAEIRALPPEVAWLRVAVPGIRPAWVHQHFSGKLIYRPVDPDALHNHALLQQAAREFDLIELDAKSGLSAEILAQVPEQKRLISIACKNGGGPALKEGFARISLVAARYYQVLGGAAGPGEALEPLLLLKSLRRTDVIAYAVGPHGFWTRIAAPYFGSPLVFGSLGDESGPGGIPTVEQLIEDYGLPAAPCPAEVFGIAGHSAFHSLSPRLHNAAYRAASRTALFVPFQVESLREFWDNIVQSDRLRVLGITVKGLTVASPHKETVLELSDAQSDIARRTASSNLCVLREGQWVADTTDPDGVLHCLRQRAVNVERRKAAVVGCGGAGRAIAHALHQAGAHVTLVNRGERRGRFASQLLGLPWVPLVDFRCVDFSIVVNATPVGRNDGMLPFSLQGLDAGSVVIDLVYGRGATPLAVEARRRGHCVIDGRDVLMSEVICQFQLMSGMPMSAALARRLVGIPSQQQAGA